MSNNKYKNIKKAEEHIIDKSSEIFPKGTKLIFPLPEFDTHIVR